MGSMDMQWVSHAGRSLGRAGWLAVLAAALPWAAPAAAEVTLDTEVSKVESTLDSGGRVQRQLVPVEEVVPGEELRYTITFSNASEMPVEPERIVIINPIPDSTVYVPGSAGGDGSVVEYSLDGETWSRTEPAGGGDRGPAPDAGPGAGDGFAAEVPESDGAGSAVRSLRWTYQEELPPGASEAVYFHVRMQ